jgi:hypothetical protein
MVSQVFRMPSEFRLEADGQMHWLQELQPPEMHEFEKQRVPNGRGLTGNYFANVLRAHMDLSSSRVQLSL